ncbi:Ribose-5-phosphate isomerase A [Anatilimnocola aggregata]|uniref:Ribose-5-phosphate isomerase A n=1 Tax=Anatilimnocola aggregata TaxID=2528021 RepID=A0A517YDR2_9BACT|nr:ribose-5-phosphate isomerase RpiA [Anatilimnocola aggregata]QDU28373.1 Ribose-5-phosphate isomerase A [Anatilimnocola aggregata]
MLDLEAEKALVAARAVNEIQAGMLVGLGTGSTSACAIRLLGARVAAGLQIEATATSLATERLARALNINLRSFEDISIVDLTIDGADQIDANLRAIKGGGGALFREKIVAAASTRTIIIADSSKLAPVLGVGQSLPLEVLPFAAAFVERCLREAGLAVSRRREPKGTLAVTDQQNYLFDVDFGAIHDPLQLATWLASIPGVIEHGLFLSEINELFIADKGQVRVIVKNGNPPLDSPRLPS